MDTSNLQNKALHFSIVILWFTNQHFTCISGGIMKHIINQCSNLIAITENLLFKCNKTTFNTVFNTYSVHDFLNLFYFQEPYFKNLQKTLFDSISLVIFSQYSSSSLIPSSLALSEIIQINLNNLVTRFCILHYCSTPNVFFQQCGICTCTKTTLSFSRTIA